MERHPIFQVADGVIWLHHAHDSSYSRRSMDIVKMRGEEYAEGLHPFHIDSEGITVYPHIEPPDLPLELPVSQERLTTGLPILDAMMGDGVVRGGTTLIVGNPGVGKTLLGLSFILAGASHKEPGIIVTLREKPLPLRRMADSLGLDIQSLESQRLLVHWRPQRWEMEPAVFASRLENVVKQANGYRVFIDSVGDMENEAREEDKWEETIRLLLNNFKRKGITVFAAHEISELFGSFELNAKGASGAADNVVLLTYVELDGRIKRAIHILKARESQHSKEIREFEVIGRSFHIGNCLHAITGILQGAPVLSEYSKLFYLSLRARYVAETLKQTGLAGFADLMQLTGLSRKDLLKQLEELQQHKVITSIEREDETLYKVIV
jgi:circadian clock protein KaiC